MTSAPAMTRERPRVIAQFLEGGEASGRIDPDAAVARLRAAARTMPIDDVCLGWGLPASLAGPVADAARAQGASVWLWHPLLSGDGRHVPGPDRAVGHGGEPVAAPFGTAEFSFDCPVRPGGRSGALERLARAIRSGAGQAGGTWDGVLLDKIRWPSPLRDPARDLACFCPTCSDAAHAAGADPRAVQDRLARAASTPEGRVDLALALLGGPADPGLAAWLDWRARAITGLVADAARIAVDRGLRVGLDVFAPGLARAVGQDIAALAPLGEFTKAMLYLGTHGPAGIAHELLALMRWMAEGGVPDPGAVLTTQCRYHVPEPPELAGGTLPVDAFDVELEALRDLAGDRAAVGIDAVWIPHVALLDDETLARMAGRAAAAGSPVVLSWDLWHISDERLGIVADALAGGMAAPGGRR